MRNVLSVLFCSCLSLIYSQDLNVSIQLKNQTTNSAVRSAQIHFGEQIFVSDSSGSANAFAKPNTNYNLRVKQLGFKPYELTFSFSKDTSFTLYLIPESIQLEEIVVEVESDKSFGVSWLNQVEGTSIYAGKKSESIVLDQLNTNLSANIGRQMFSKIPGINVFENDGSGNSVGIGGRGMNPSRMANFNTRQNGYDISADALGYPESYYTPPAEAVERIDLVRGAAGLQYGTQFGGMINYKLYAPEKKKLAGNFSQTIGSFGSFNSFNQLSGTSGKISYQTFYQYKTYKGWRDRSEVNNHTAFIGLGYQLSSRIKIKAEYTYMTYLSQQAGGLTDEQFNKDATFVNRNRNWFKVNWNLCSIGVDYELNETTKLNLNTFGLFAGRDALGYLGRPDLIDDTSAYRTLMRDKYQNYGAELKLLKRYKLLGNNNHLLLGARVYRGQTIREQGNADKTANPNFTFLNPNNLENSAFTFPTTNYAFFTENIFQLSTKWSVVPGLRYEYINTASEGYYRLINKDASGAVVLDTKVNDQQESSRNVILLGMGTQYKINKVTEFYANFSQNYKAINFNDLRVTNSNMKVDPELMDESGYTFDGGFRGKVHDILYFDVSMFFVHYNNRIGSLSIYDSITKQTVRYRTNIGYSDNQGLEAFVELDWIRLFQKNAKHKLSTFINASVIKANYHTSQTNIDGKKVEYVPQHILRTGINYAYKGFGFTFQYSFTSEQFSDASNSLTSTTGLTGVIPSYAVLDFSMHYNWRKFSLKTGINNFTNSKYFTRRADGFPGPGIIPADPINAYLTLGFRF